MNLGPGWGRLGITLAIWGKSSWHLKNDIMEVISWAPEKKKRWSRGPSEHWGRGPPPPKPLLKQPPESFVCMTEQVWGRLDTNGKRDFVPSRLAGGS